MKTKQDGKWYEIEIKVPKEGSDWISYYLTQLGSIGNIEEDCPDPALIAMRGYFPTELGPSNAILQQIKELMHRSGYNHISTYSHTIKLQNWAENARQMFEPIKIVQDITIINPWSKYSKKDNEQTIIIDPGMAFGTGYHQTTKIAAKLIKKVITNNKIKTMADIGSGSGILSLIAAKMNVDKIKAVEIDTDARKSSEENIKRNHASKRITVHNNISQLKGKYDLVVANIILPVIKNLSLQLVELTKNNSYLVISGITNEEDKKLLTLFKKLELIEKIQIDNWLGYLYRK